MFYEAMSELQGTSLEVGKTILETHKNMLRQKKKIETVLRIKHELGKYIQ